jgi:hypothetical protein
MAEVGSREGYLVIADIAGYTAFLTATELEHAQSIIAELIALIRARLAPPLRFVKLEGDAVFCYGKSTGLKDGERLIELLEVCYFDFSNLVFNMARATTCRCAACASIDMLDLKFVAHYGSFVVQRDGANEDLIGPDVILAHRLLKNSIVEVTGVEAYAFLTDACIRRLPQKLDLRRHAEAYESFPETTGGIHDLQRVAREMRDARVEYVSRDEADHETRISVPHPPAVVWQYVIDPVQRLRWACVMFNKDPDAVQPNTHGRSGLGAKGHCNHGPAEANREVVDWRPFTYFTTRGVTKWRWMPLPAQQIMETYEFTPLEDGTTELSWRLRFVDHGVLARLTLGLIRRSFRGGVGSRGGARLKQAIRQDLMALDD